MDSSAVGRPAFAAEPASTFETVDVGQPQVTLRVERVEDYEPDGRRFSVFLSGPVDQALAQGTHTLAPENGEAFALFLVPIERDEGRLVYEAAFNRAE